MLGKFMLDDGWLQSAKDEMDRLNRDLAGPMKQGRAGAVRQADGGDRQDDGRLVVPRRNWRWRRALQVHRRIARAFPEKTAAREGTGPRAKVSAT